MSNARVLSTLPSAGVTFRNRIINGDMKVDQRNSGSSVTCNSNTYGLDRWEYVVSQTGKLTVQQNAGSVTPPAGFVNYMGYTSTSAYSVGTTEYFYTDQSIEGYNVSDLGWGTASAKTVTLSFWVRSSLTGTFGGSLQNSAKNRSYPFTYTISTANTWEQKSITIAGDTSGTWLTTNGIGLTVTFGLGIGLTSIVGPAGSWAGADYRSATGATSVVGTNGATFYITGVQLEKGSVATPYEVLPYQVQLAQCQRYYCKSFNPSIVPAPSAAQAIYSTFATYSSSNGYVAGVYPYPVQMRAAPTVTFYTSNSSPTTGQWDYYAGGSWTAFTATGVQTNSTNMLCVGVTGSGFSAWSSYLCSGNFTASAEL